MQMSRAVDEIFSLVTPRATSISCTLESTVNQTLGLQQGLSGQMPTTSARFWLSG